MLLPSDYTNNNFLSQQGTSINAFCHFSKSYCLDIFPIP